MLPELVISKNIRDAKEYVHTFCKEHGLIHIFYFGEDESLSIDTIREINKEVTKPSLVHVVYVLFNFDTTKKEAQNAFLKTLEEQTRQATFFLVVKDEFAVLSTIASRCKTVHIHSHTQYDPALKKAASVLALSAKTTDFLLYTSALSKEKQLHFAQELRSLIYEYIHEHIETDNIQEIATHYATLEKIMEIEYQLKNNINPEFALDYIFFTLLKKHVIPFPLS